jgi:NADH dehydrogenase [ubiquinone] 1 alpha subcomplex assembly factor 1
MNTILLNSSLFLFSSSILALADTQETKLLDDFKPSKANNSWISVNDGVMGGLSQGGPEISKDHKLEFKGEISLENNGGFSSIRTRGTSLDLSSYDGIEIKIKGDGRMYYLTARSNNKRMLAYWSPIQPPKNEWVTIRVPFDSFYASYFGKKVPFLKLNTQKITSLGFMLYDKKSGPFALEVDHIMAYKEAEVSRSQ